jgi:hypothetical protein
VTSHFVHTRHKRSLRTTLASIVILTMSVLFTQTASAATLNGDVDGFGSAAVPAGAQVVLSATPAPYSSLGECGSGWGRYIVVFKDFVVDPEPLAKSQVAKYGGVLGFIYRHALKGYSAEFPMNAVSSIAQEPTVEFISRDQPVTIAGMSSREAFDASAGNVCAHPPPPVPSPEEPEQETKPREAPVIPRHTGDHLQGDDGQSQTIEKSRQVKRCPRDEVHRRGRCTRKRALARRICQAHRGTAKRRCIRRTMRRLSARSGVN